LERFKCQMVDRDRRAVRSTLWRRGEQALVAPYHAKLLARAGPFASVNVIGFIV
jgi:hypothetical protein